MRMALTLSYGARLRELERAPSWQASWTPLDYRHT